MVNDLHYFYFLSFFLYSFFYVDLLQREKLNSQSFILFRNCFSHIPPILPSGLNEGELVAILSRNLIHIDGGN